MPVLVTYTEAAGNVHFGPGYYFKNILRPGYKLRPLIQPGAPPSVSDPVTPAAWAAGVYAAGAMAIDGNNNVIFTPGGGTASDGGITDWITSAPSWVWKASTPVIYDQQVRAASGNIWQCIQAGTTGTPSAPSDTGVPYGGIVGDGSAVWMNLGPTISIGSHEGALEFEIGAKQADVMSDSYSDRVDTVIVGESGSIDGTFQEILPSNLSRILPNTVYSSGTDPLFPTNAQNYQQLTWGGALRVPNTCDFLCSYRRNFGNSQELSTQPFKYFGGVIYKAGPSSDGKAPFTLKKATQYKVAIKSSAVTWRPAGDQIGQFWEQI